MSEINVRKGLEWLNAKTKIDGESKTNAERLKNYHTGLVSCAMLHKSGDHATPWSGNRSRTHSACYSFMGHADEGWELVINHIGPKNASYQQRMTDNKDMHSFWIDYFVNFSPWQEIFPQKDSDEILELGFILNTTDYPCNLMQGALVGLRQLWENGQQAPMYYELAKEGVDADVAWMLSHLFRVDGETVSRQDLMHSHNLFGGVHWTLGMAKNFFARNFTTKTKNFSAGGTYAGNSSQFNWHGPELIAGRNAYQNITTYFKADLEKAIGGTKQKANSNPFGAAAVNNARAVWDKKAFVKGILAVEDKILELVNA